MAALNGRFCVRLRACSCRNGSSNVWRAYNKRCTHWSRPVFRPKEDSSRSPPGQKEPSVIAELRSRGLISNSTNETGLEQALESGRLTAYCGVDPTADSLHVGNLLTLMPLVHLLTRGHKIIPLIGGFTCQIGDPSGRASDRDNLAMEVARSNSAKITSQVEKLFKTLKSYALLRGYTEADMGNVEIMNNEQWWKSMTLQEFFNEIARHMRLAPMLARERYTQQFENSLSPSVKLRLQSPEGIDVASFLYQSLQAYDFLRLNQLKKCRLQVGGSDQWGNIVAGIDLCQKFISTKPAVFGLTVPLLLAPSGEKFGKSAGNALFLDPNATHPFDLYQYFLRVEDEHAGQYLRLLTLLPIQRIEQIVQEHAKTPERRLAQRTLADEIVTMIHGHDVAQRCIFQTAALYPAPHITSKSGDKQTGFGSEPILHAFRGDEMMLKRFSISSLSELSLPRLLKAVGIVKSISDAFRALQNGGIHINGKPEQRIDKVSYNELLLDGKVMVIRHGRSSFRVVEVVSDEQAAYKMEE